MKLAVLSAAGRSGRLITAEALRRGHTVTAFVLDREESLPLLPAGAEVVSRSILELTREDLAPFDAVIDCFGVWRDEDAHLHTDTLRHLADCLSGTEIRLLVIGGAGGLYTDSTHTRLFHEDPNFPADTRTMSAAQAASYAYLRTRGDIRYTYLCPNGLYLPDAPRTGSYTLAEEELLPNPTGEIPLQAISYADYAIAMVDLAEERSESSRRLSVYHKA